MLSLDVCLLMQGRFKICNTYGATVTRITYALNQNSFCPMIFLYLLAYTLCPVGARVIVDSYITSFLGEFKTDEFAEAAVSLQSVGSNSGI
jgi:hypothetical protein